MQSFGSGRTDAAPVGGVGAFRTVPFWTCSNAVCCVLSTSRVHYLGPGSTDAAPAGGGCCRKFRALVVCTAVHTGLNGTAPAEDSQAKGGLLFGVYPALSVALS
jgi:hypothetical protein